MNSKTSFSFGGEVPKIMADCNNMHDIHKMIKIHNFITIILYLKETGIAPVRKIKWLKVNLEGKIRFQDGLSFYNI